MKEVLSELQQHLLTERHYLSCDVYDLYLKNGAPYYFCDFDEDIVWNGHTYDHNACIVVRNNTEIGNKLTVDKMTLTLSVDEDDTIGDTEILTMARNGGFDGASLVCSRVYLNDDGKVIGGIKLFSGNLEVKSGGGMTVKLDVKSKIQMLNVEWPIHRYYPTCPFSLYSEACGVNPESFRTNATVIQVTDKSHFVIDAEKEDGYFNNGACYFMSGPLSGKGATIKESVGGAITLLVSEEDAPKVGDTVKLYAGCNKTSDMCKSRFNNWYRNRSTPYVPLREASM